MQGRFPKNSRPVPSIHHRLRAHQLLVVQRTLPMSRSASLSSPPAMRYSNRPSPSSIAAAVSLFEARRACSASLSQNSNSNWFTGAPGLTRLKSSDTGARLSALRYRTTTNDGSCVKISLRPTLGPLLKLSLFLLPGLCLGAAWS